MQVERTDVLDSNGLSLAVGASVVHEPTGRDAEVTAIVGSYVAVAFQTGGNHVCWINPTSRRAIGLQLKEQK